MHLLELLARYVPLDEREAAHTERLRAFLSQAKDDAFGREMAGHEPFWGHVTGSAWVVSSDRSRVLMVHHAKLGRWVQPGGHCDGEADVLSVARREVREETGLDAVPLSHEIFDVDVHPIPKYWSIAEHLHFDVRFLLQADDTFEPIVSPESRAVRWVSLDEALRLNPSGSITRMVAKTRVMG